MRYFLPLILLLTPALGLADFQIIRAATCSTYNLDQSDATVSPHQSPGGALMQSAIHYVDGFCAITIPQASCLEQVTVYGSDTVLQAFTFSVHKAKYANENTTVLAQWSSVNALVPWLVTPWKSPLIHEPIDNNTYTYFFYFAGHPLQDPNGLRIWNISVAYTPGGCL